ncbi:MAG: glycine cleavage system protein R [Halorhodospira sp.]
MQNLMVITALGHDRPGIVRELSSAVTETGCNIEDSRMSVLGGEFAILLMISGRWNELAKLESSLPNSARRMGLEVHLRRTAPPERGEHLLPYTVEVVALDHPGIVSELANFFAEREINIRDLTTASYAAAHTGTPMFSVLMSIDVPAGLHIATLRDEFMEFCDQFNLDAIMEPAK